MTQLAEQRRAFQEKLAERQNVMVPHEDPDYGFLRQAWPWQERDPDAILQPPKPELRPCAGIERIAEYEMPEMAAGRSVEEVLADYPYLERADILAALEFAADAVQEHELPLARSV